MMGWVWGRLKCWVGYHEPLMCGGHKSSWTKVAAEHKRECLNAYCPRCNRCGSRLETIWSKTVKPLPQAKTVRRIVERKGCDRRAPVSCGHPVLELERCDR